MTPLLVEAAIWPKISSAPLDDCGGVEPGEWGQIVDYTSTEVLLKLGGGTGNAFAIWIKTAVVGNYFEEDHIYP